MRSFAGALPELAFDLSLELRATGRADLARFDLSLEESVNSGRGGEGMPEPQASPPRPGLDRQCKR